MAELTKNSSLTKVLLWLHPIQRILISLFLAFIVFIFIRHSYISGLLRIMIIWNVFAFSLLFLSWAVFSTRTTQQIREYARNDDGNLAYIFFLIVISAFASMVTVTLLMISKDVTGVPIGIYLPVAIGGIIFSWALVHTTFTFHYALLYYDDDDNNPKEKAGGLAFPEEDEPDYLDFAYFSFIIGMTFQVSDVQTTSRKFRRWVLLHSLLAFLLNTFVVALTINLIASLKN